jgi:predicted CopG family antitoxin
MAFWASHRIDSSPLSGLKGAVDRSDQFVHDSCMSKTITIDDDAYKLLRSLKQNGRDSFTKVILRHVYRPAETCGELLEMTEKHPPPPVDLKVLDRIAAGRGRKSGGRK